jgi:hypothetical protein
MGSANRSHATGRAPGDGFVESAAVEGSVFRPPGDCADSDSLATFTHPSGQLKCGRGAGPHDRPGAVNLSSRIRAGKEGGASALGQAQPRSKLDPNPKAGRAGGVTLVS